jgi:uncharacterized protein
MKCPVCTEPDLVMSERQGVEIDYCPRCRGVWLDRGELDKIIERSDRDDDDDDNDRRRTPPPIPGSYAGGEGHGYGHKPYKKKSFWHELFD